MVRKLQLFVLLFAFVNLFSCIDPDCTIYKVETNLVNYDKNFTQYKCSLKGGKISDHYLFAPLLTQENNYIDTEKVWIMEPQMDFVTKPYSPWKEVLDFIENGATFTVEAKDKTGKVSKFNLPYAKEDIKNVTPSGSMYRQYKLTLDWNKKVVVEN